LVVVCSGIVWTATHVFVYDIPVPLVGLREAQDVQPNGKTRGLFSRQGKVIGWLWVYDCIWPIHQQSAAFIVNSVEYVPFNR